MMTQSKTSDAPAQETVNPQVDFIVRLAPPLVVSSNTRTAGGDARGAKKEMVGVSPEQADVPAMPFAPF